MLARGHPGWNTECCDRSPAYVEHGKWVCPGCAQIWYDTAMLVERIFGEGVVRVRAQRAWKSMIDHDQLIDRWVDA